MRLICYIVILSLPLFLLNSCVSTGGERLQYRELRVFTTNFEVSYKVIYESNQPYLYISAPAANYRLQLRAYIGDTKTTILWKTSNL